ncbi:zinc-binding dehydrogenase [Streptomyces sp. URMC 129]|uniref:zinc-binding dehydrogenase n=1 Tax=Streptomyces sp. URMC 129 TaxID=3423407 RepID=UPI003F1A9F67
MRDGTTAMALFGPAGVEPGEWVLITAAGGGMGLLLVRLARKPALVRELGAEVVRRRHRAGLDGHGARGDGRRRGGGAVGGRAGGEIGRAACAVAAGGARVSAHGAPSSSFAPIDPADAARRHITLTGIAELQLSPAESVRRTAEAVEAAAGRMRPHISHTFPLERAADAHAATENREVLGKALLLARAGPAPARDAVDGANRSGRGRSEC